MEHDQFIRYRIKKIAEKYCEDYPGIVGCSIFESLYAIECTLEGLTEANKDLCEILNRESRADDLQD